MKFKQIFAPGPRAAPQIGRTWRGFDPWSFIHIEHLSRFWGSWLRVRPRCGAGLRMAARPQV